MSELKLLLVGMDGAHPDVFHRGWTPYISSLFKDGKQLKIKNDLVSRGWLEITTGKHACTTGAMYDKPMADGSLVWDSNFNINDIPGIGATVKPIWQALNELGYRVGVMNLPTAFPAPEVDGFFVSGGGGGGAVVQNPTPEFCFPREIVDLLHKNDYIVDERFVQLVVDKKFGVSEIFNRMSYKNERRTKSFIELANKFDIEFGFIVYKTSSVLAEAMLMPEWEKVQDNDENIDKELVDAVKQYYKKFDQEIKKLHEEFPNSEMVFVSDHGMAARKYSVNVNIILQGARLQVVKKNKTIAKNIVEILKATIPFSIKMALKKSDIVKNTVAAVTNLDVTRTKAFSHTQGDWSHGVFINDNSRFGGPVGDSDFDDIKSLVIQEINSHPDAIAHQIRAYDFGCRAVKLNKFPDILIDIPDGYLTTDRTDSFISAYVHPKNSTSLSAIMKGTIPSIKTHKPLAMGLGTIFTDEQCDVSGDLTLVYDYILNYFKSVRR